MACEAQALVQGKHSAPGLVRRRGSVGRGEWLDQYCEQKTGMVQGIARFSSGGNGIAVQANGALCMQESLQAEKRSCPLRKADTRHEVQDKTPRRQQASAWRSRCYMKVQGMYVMLALPHWQQAIWW